MFVLLAARLAQMFQACYEASNSRVSKSLLPSPPDDQCCGPSRASPTNARVAKFLASRASDFSSCPNPHTHSVHACQTRLWKIRGTTRRRSDDVGSGGQIDQGHKENRKETQGRREREDILRKEALSALSLKQGPHWDPREKLLASWYTA